ncbi:MAG TPA: methionine--tRNA ligase [Candidatus Woesebacteria bacterium]|nr:methionine--tRNA ligase [Candidatus Woesebacteria bacterium]
MKKDTITFQDFIKTDIRVGEVLEASLVEGSSKLIELTVNFGEDYGTRTVFTGMQKWYSSENFQGKKFLFVANLEPKKMMGKESQGMILSLDKDGDPLLVEVSAEYEPGLPAL